MGHDGGLNMRQERAGALLVGDTPQVLQPLPDEADVRPGRRQLNVTESHADGGGDASRRRCPFVTFIAYLEGVAVKKTTVLVYIRCVFLPDESTYTYQVPRASLRDQNLPNSANLASQVSTSLRGCFLRSGGCQHRYPSFC